MSNSQLKPSQSSNPWNPISPTKRDVERTEELANKDTFTAGILTFLFFPAAMLYLNRGVNSLKIFAYALCIAIPISSIIAELDKEAFSMSSKIGGSISAIVITFENISAITKAKKRQSANEA